MSTELPVPASITPHRQPLLHGLLATVAERRKERIRGDLSETHFDGFEELFRFLDAASQRFAQHPLLNKVAALVQRLRADFETGLCAFLSGLDQATFDSMRDVMEIEYLLREFLHEPASVDPWLDATDEDRWRKFGPGQLRRRHAARLGISTDELLDTYEYRAHSATLHVSPHGMFPVERGVSKSPYPQLGAAFALADILHHARDIVFLIYKLAEGSSPSLKLDHDPATMPKLQSAFELSMRRYHNAWMLVDIAGAVAEHRRASSPIGADEMPPRESAPESTATSAPGTEPKEGAS
ncbi:MAG: hypothetical protein HYS13_16790 [Planctomycetia bacterium]|nr:hypothetical protein [Planctomycetia bacterium]